MPPYVGAKGWVGIQLDHPLPHWDEVGELIAAGYSIIAPKRLARKVTGPPLA